MSRGQPIGPPSGEARTSLKRQLPLAAFLLVLGALVVFAAAAYREIHNTLVASGRARLNSVTQQLVTALQQSGQQILLQVNGLAARKEVQALLAAPPGAGPSSPVEPLARAILGTSPEQRVEVSIHDLTGGSRFAQRNGQPLPAAPVAARPAPGLSPLWLQGSTVLYDAVAYVKDSQQHPVGFVLVRRALGSAQGVAAINRLIGSGAELLLGNQQGHLWTDLINVVPGPSPAEFAAASKSPIALMGRGGAPLIARTAPLDGTPWRVCIEFDQRTLVAPARSLLERFGLIGLLVLTLAAGGAWALGVVLTRPIREVMETAEIIAGGDFSRRVNPRGPAELGRLSRAFNHMTEELSSAYGKLEQRVEERTRDLNAALAELKSTQAELVQKEKLALLGQLSSGVGHELRNPLAVMTNAVYYLELVLSAAPEEVREYLGILRHQIGLSEKIVGDLLDFARIRTPQARQVEVAELVAREVERLGPLDGVTLTQDFAHDLPSVLVDPTQAGQVILNLLTNATQAVTDGQGVVEVRGRRMGELRIRIEVEDNGPGVPEQLRDRIFEPLFTTKARGIGLGLSVSRGLARANSGELELAPAVANRGAVFVFELPAANQS